MIHVDTARTNPVRGSVNKNSIVNRADYEHGNRGPNVTKKRLLSYRLLLRYSSRHCENQGIYLGIRAEMAQHCFIPIRRRQSNKGIEPFGH